MLKFKETLSTLLGSLFGVKPKTNQQDKENCSETTIQLTKIRPIDGTPFHTAMREEGRYTIVMGNHLITNEIFTSRGACEKAVSNINWWMLLNVVGIYMDKFSKENNLKQIN